MKPANAQFVSLHGQDRNGVLPVGPPARVTSINRAPQQAYANAEQCVLRHSPEWDLSSDGWNPTQAPPRHSGVRRNPAQSSPRTPA